VIRERLQHCWGGRRDKESLAAIADLIGAVDGLPADLSTRKKHYLRVTNYGLKPKRR